MKLKVTAISLALSLASFQGIAKDSVDQLAEKMDAIAHEFIAPDGPGCAVGIVQDGSFLFRKNYGLANVEHVVPVTSSTRFRMASVSKQFTAMAVLLLADDG